MVSSTYLFYLVNLVSKSKFDHIRTYWKLWAVLNLHTFFWNVHPSPIFTVEINYIEIFKAIKLKLSMFSWQTSSLNLQCQIISLSVPRTKQLSFDMSRQVKESIFVNSIDALQRVFNRKLIDFCDVYFVVKIVKVIFFDVVNFILVFLFLFFRRFGSLLFGRISFGFGNGWLGIFRWWPVRRVFGIFSIVHRDNK